MLKAVHAGRKTGKETWRLRSKDSGEGKARAGWPEADGNILVRD